MRAKPKRFASKAERLIQHHLKESKFAQRPILATHSPVLSGEHERGRKAAILKLRVPTKI
ncbi:hypothetical protein EMPG_14373 [Blastomyces silverae]|uniref:Uncharacterized protein n=1 Tax=Blastomyces silverae TaxID=2060906 RepID=A0A0H1BFU0_9EURO|nr:hypothetical protein EMPG_14373 [Blastomyces silverae]